MAHLKILLFLTIEVLLILEQPVDRTGKDKQKKPLRPVSCLYVTNLKYVNVFFFSPDNDVSDI